MPKRINEQRTFTPEEMARIQEARDYYHARQPTLAEAVNESADGLNVTLGEYWLMRDVARSLKAARLNQALTLDEVSKRSGVEVDDLARIESGDAINATMSKISRVAAALGKSVHVTISDGSNPPSA